MLFTCINYHVIARSRHKGGDVAIPRLEGKCIENFPKIYGIATPVLQSAADLVMAMIAGGNHTLIGCALVRNDVLLFTALNNNLSI